jgi:GNAT superfamily N-acetyltransferase
MEIIHAYSDQQIETIRTLFREYEAFLQVDLCFQGFEAELAGLPGRYDPPRGALLLAMAGKTAAGCVALRPLDAQVCEMKRLFVRPQFLRRGIGNALTRAIIEKAQEAHYQRMVLDTLDKLKPALALYTRLGFEQCEPYYPNPLPGAIYLQLDLKRNRSPAASPPGRQRTIV